MNFEEFLALQSKANELSWWQRIRIKVVNKWWTSIRKANPDMDAAILWESIRKGRF